MHVKDISPENRPRERLERQGAAALSNAELLAIVLKSGTQKENVLEICHKLLAKYHLQGLASCTLAELEQEHGIGNAKACQILAVLELSQRLQQDGPAPVSITKAEDIAFRYMAKVRHLPQERVMALYLNAKHQLMAEETITVGLVNASLIHPREIFYGAVKHLAYAVIVVHNHPSGDPTPSVEDLRITKQLEKTGEIMGIRLLDHIIVGKDTWWSWRENS